MKTLLSLLTAVCLAFGGWHLIKKYGQFIDAQTTTSGEPFLLEGRLIRLYGPKRLHYCLDVFGRPPEWQSGIACLYTCYGFAERSGPFTYRIHAKHHLNALPGDYELKLVEGYHPNEPTVFGMLRIESR